jgi:Flagellar hook capping protein
MVNKVSGSSSTSGSNGTSGSTQETDSTSLLGKDDFLKLLAVQMQNQDPMNPMDNSQSIAQLAQFSALEQMNNIATSINTLNTNMTSFMQQSALSQGAALIGKLVSGVDTDGTTTIEGTVEAVKWLDGDPKLQVRKADGTLVDLEMSLITSVKEPSASTATTPGATS